MTSSSTSRKDFTLWMGDKNNLNASIPMISIVQESNGKEYICFEENIKEIGHSSEFHNRWHSLKVLMDQINYKISIIMDGQPVFKNLPISPDYQFNPAVSISTTPCDTTDVEIDDFTVLVFYSINGEKKFSPLFMEDFERFIEGRFPYNSGWHGREKIQTEKDISTDIIECISVQSEYVNGNKSLKINNSERHPFIVVKHFNIPENFPFDISDKTFSIVYNKDMEELSFHHSEIGRHEAKSLNNNLPPSTSTLTSTLTCDQKNIHGPNTDISFANTSSTSVFGTIQSTSPVDTYYIYSFDGKLMAEYDHNGNCVKDYIYAGNRLIAEYQPQTNKYYYYMSDQINSTRIVTDDNGNVVYSEAYGPFGGIQKNWTKAYDPKLKFSGKEREVYSDLDYFGARYYDHNSYRFISVDPIINKEEAISNPQIWNLYSYCRNNPITFMDPNGMRDYFVFMGFQNTGWVSKNDFTNLSSDLHFYEAGKFTLKDFQKALATKDAVTFFFGHSDYQTTITIGGMKYTGTKELENSIIGIFACNSSKFAYNKFWIKGKNIVIAIRDDLGDGSRSYSMIQGGFNILKALIDFKNDIDDAVDYGNRGFHKEFFTKNQGDVIEYRK